MGGEGGERRGTPLLRPQGHPCPAPTPRLRHVVPISTLHLPDLGKRAGEGWQRPVRALGLLGELPEPREGGRASASDPVSHPRAWAPGRGDPAGSSGSCEVSHGGNVHGDSTSAPTHRVPLNHTPGSTCEHTHGSQRSNQGQTRTKTTPVSSGLTPVTLRLPGRDGVGGRGG